MQNITSIDFCTIGPSNKSKAGQQIIYSDDTGFPMCNSILCDGTVYKKIFATNCAFKASLYGAAGFTKVETNNCLFIESADMPKAADGFVPSATSLLNNAGDRTLAPGCEDEVDLAGTPRVLNGGVDIGAFEHDWRSEYTTALGPQRVQVTGASPDAVLQGGAVTLNGGALAGAFVANEGARLRFSVLGEGSLKLYVKGVLVGTYTATSAIQEVLVRDVSAGDDFRFEHVLAAGETGSVSVCRSAGTSGLILFFR